MKRVFIFLIFGLASGSLSTILLSDVGGSFLPGLIFALSILCCYVFFEKRSWRSLKSVGWIVGSTLAYFLAFKTASSWYPPDAHGMKSWVIAGMFGGFVMLMGFCFFIARIKVHHVVILIIVAGFLSVTAVMTDGGPSTYSLSFPGSTLHSFYAFLEDFQNILLRIPLVGPLLFDRPYAALFVFWQTGMALGLSLATNLHMRNETV